MQLQERRRARTAKGSKTSSTNRVPRVIAVFLLAVVALLVTMAAAGIVEDASIGSRSWQVPAVGQTVNGYAGAPVGSPLYLQAGYEHNAQPSVNG